MANRNAGLISADAQPWQDILEETTAWLQDLVRIDTSNPPGNERPAAEYVQDVLAREEIEAEILGPLPHRTSLLARVRGDGRDRPLLLVSHLDVVPATPVGWDVEPFSGVIKDEHVWGRGAMDCKHRVAIHAMMLVLAKRGQLKLKRDLVMAACADEETGGHLGMGWLAENHLEKIDAEFVLGEGGGSEVPAPQGSYLAVGTAEKGSGEVTITVRGPGGHSLRLIPDSALIKLGQVLNRLENMRLSSALTETVASTIQGLAPGLSPRVREAMFALLTDATREEGMAALREHAPDLARWFEPSLYNSVVPTMVSGGISAHSYPTEVKLFCNVRFLPGQGLDEVLALLRARLSGIEGVEISEAEESAFASESSSDTDLFKSISDLYSEVSPGTVAVPWLLGGSTDVRFLRAQGRVVYGLFPSVFGPPSVRGTGGHCPNERVSLHNINWALQVLFTLVTRLCT